MRLIQVSANKESFRTVSFNPKGLSFIVAKQKDPENTEKGRTYNGVGKSLLVKIIHFCLGASKQNYSSFYEQLPGWEFTLEFCIGDVRYISTRLVDDPSNLLLNGERLSCAAFNKKLGELCFSNPANVDVLSFRSLLPFFIRPERSSYTSYKKTNDKLPDYQVMLLNAHLLGLDMSLAQHKSRVKVEVDKIKSLLSSFKKDGLLRDYSTGAKDVALKLLDLDERIKHLEENLSSFVVAEDYYDVQKEADKLKEKVDSLHNTVSLLQSNITRIDETLEIDPTIRNEELVGLYNEVGIYFSERLIKTLEEVQDFHDKLITSRQRRLLEQRNEISARIREATHEQKHLSDELDKKLQYLGGHKALDVFVSVNNTYSDLKAEREKLLHFQSLQKDLEENKRILMKQNLDLEEETAQYLSKMENEISKLRDYFKELANRFYPKSVAGLSITNNTGNNQLRYTIDAMIESDSSDGINSVKIFCYDLTLLLKGHNHSMSFLFHDSRLFSDIDERQKAEMFTIVSELFANSPYQYIATINQNQLEEIKKVLGEATYNAIIKPFIVLELTDESPEAKLLGVSVEIGEK